MNLRQIDRLLAAVPPGVEARQRARVHGYAATARRCEERIGTLRTALEQAQQKAALAALSAAGDAVRAADDVLRIAQELEALERVQPRVDAWLRVAAGALTDAEQPAPFGEGEIA